MKPNIVWYDIPALDLDRAIQFYSAVLGAPVKKDETAEIPLGWLPTEDGGQMGCVCVAPNFKPSADGVMIYSDYEQRFEALAPPSVPRGEVIDELYDAAVRGKRTLHNGEWAMATMEVCLAMRESAQRQQDVTLQHQVVLS